MLFVIVYPCGDTSAPMGAAVARRLLADADARWPGRYSLRRWSLVEVF
jgi:hypothetical protein